MSDATPAAGPILDPRDGDIEDDASSTKQRSLISLAGSLLVEISLPKLVAAWLLMLGLPALLLGVAPLLVSIWIESVSHQAAVVFSGVWPLVVLVILGAVGWIAGRRLLRAAERSFWSLNALAVQPLYAACREGLRHLTESGPARRLGETGRARLRAATAVVSGLVICAVGLGVIALVWRHTRWSGSPADLAAPLRLVPVVLANCAELLALYLAAAALIWGFADATMAQPRDLAAFDAPPSQGRAWRVAHLSDLHVVGEPYGFRIESGRAGPRGNGRLERVFARLEALDAEAPLDLVLISGDMTDAGRSGEWAAFFAALAKHPRLAARTLALPGNHDVNVVDRASPARLELPMSPMKRLRQMRTVSALAALQGGRVRVVDPATRRLGGTLDEALAPHAAAMRTFADRGTVGLGRALAPVWESIFPMVLPPAEADGLGAILLNSNAETHFSFTNALGLMPTADARVLAWAAAEFPRACWVVGLHHHVVEYPQPAKALSERIGTALINGSWFVRRLRPLAARIVVLHGHRHVDWMGACGDLRIVSAPSPVMNATDGAPTAFYVQRLARGDDGRLLVLQPERVEVAGEPAARDGGSG
jgi:hypothetical protein